MALTDSTAVRPRNNFQNNPRKQLADLSKQEKQTASADRLRQLNNQLALLCRSAHDQMVRIIASNPVKLAPQEVVDALPDPGAQLQVIDQLRGLINLLRPEGIAEMATSLPAELTVEVLPGGKVTLTKTK